ncbi:MAG: rhodanese-like domain-containing protein [Ekhidna sp.]|nr:rhodanese-like domain-containing protein [Ekhidna sp.]
MELIKGHIMKWVWIAFFAFACGSTDAQKASRIGNEKLVELLKTPDLQLLDVRTPEEVSYGIIETATVIDFYDPEFAAKVSQLDKDKPIAVYCAAGGRSANASKKLIDLGFKEIYDLKEGYRGWTGAGYPTVKDK